MAKAKAKAKVEQDKAIVEELYFRSESAYLCLLLNRRSKWAESKHTYRAESNTNPCVWRPLLAASIA